ncbi:MAG TPA: TonB-dependent receptor [Bryobacteraceae bacterium]|nr:TonB-dependent receptor [Bryobacteraceae bacterium]
MHKALCTLIVAVLMLGSVAALQAQTATGTISGTVTDESGAVVPNATITITNKATSNSRTLTANAEGLYSAPALLAGDYEVRAELAGFRTEVRSAQVLAGSSTTVNMALSVGATQEVVNVEAATAQINYESHTVAGSIERSTIQGMPLNGRSFLQLASLEPGVQVITGAQGARNAPIQISILGGATNVLFTLNNTLLTLDGLSVMDMLDGGNTSLNFSQEMVQEFQINSLNYDLGSGFTANGAVNIVSRSGGNDFHGSGFYFYRDHNMAAYPGLKRSTQNPNPFFSRKNPGFYVSGPIKKDKIFFFFNFENTNQVQAVTFQPDIASILPLANNFSSPARYHYRNIRFDYRISDKHTAFLRYTHDGNAVFGPETGQPSEPSAWINLNNWSDQFAMGLTSTLTPNLVNDFRLAWRMWDNKEDPPTAGQCLAPCVNQNGPSMSLVGSSVFTAGVTGNALQRRIARHYEPQDTLSWEKGAHRLKIGGDLDVYVDLWFYGFYSRSFASAYSPEITLATIGSAAAATYLPNLPSRITSTADLFNLPLSVGQAYLGNLILPGLYHQDSERRNLRPRLFAQDTWKLRSNLTVNYGVGWQAETGAFNSDLSNPQFLAPILGANNLHPTPIDWRNFGPAVGFAWSPGKSGKTVFRGGGGLYWDTMPGYLRMDNVGVIGPLGNGPIGVASNVFTNTFPGVMQLVNGQLIPLNVGAAIPAGVFTTFTVGDWVQTYAQQAPAINAVLGPTPPTHGPYSVTPLNISKSSSSVSTLYPPNVSITRSYQVSFGVQRDLGHDMVLQADWARRQNENTQLAGVDLNHFNEFVNSARTPVIPACTTTPDLNPNDECSTGALGFQENQGRAIYEALLVKVQKRLSHRYQFTGSYAYQNLNALSNIVNYYSWFQSYGPLIPRHNLNISGVVNLPLGFELSVNSSILSRNPIMPTVTGIDLPGTGAAAAGSPIPGLPYRCFPYSCGKDDLAKAVAAFNSTYAGTKTPNGRVIPQYVLPSNYQFGDPTFSQDFRLTKTFSYKERYRLMIMGEMFNAFNIANLTGYSFALDTKNANPAAQTFAFGHPTQRAGQTFLSYGPRAVQLGARFSF